MEKAADIENAEPCILMHEDQSGLDQVRGIFCFSVEQILNELLFLAFAIPGLGYNASERLAFSATVIVREAFLGAYITLIIFCIITAWFPKTPISL